MNKETKTTEFPVVASGASEADGDVEENQIQSSAKKAQDTKKNLWWVAVVRFFIGVMIVLGALIFSENMDTTIQRWGYVPVMFVFLLVMITGGGLMVSGFSELWDRIKENK